jgi:putative endonuclease
LEKRGYVYIMASKPNGTLYIGVTSDLLKRAWEHREGVAEGFTKRYGCKLLVWFEVHDRIEMAIQHEKQMKEWRRAWKIRRIVEMNPDWTDLFPTLA